MPSSANRTQVLLPDDIQAQVRMLAKRSKRSMSAMCSELIEYALTHGEEYKDTTTKLDIKQDTLQALLGGAVLDDQRMRKLLKLLDMLD
jgi:hypothetical protein